MGFHGTVGATKNDIVADVTRTETTVTADGATRIRSIIAQSLRANDLWIVEQVSVDDVEQERQIVVYRLGAMRGNRFHAGWGYKPESEQMGPVPTSCPLRFFVLVPEPPNDDGARWRIRVRAYHAAQAIKRFAVAQARVGRTYRLPPNNNWKIPRFTLLSTTPLIGTYEGNSYRVSARALAAATAIPAANL